MENYNQKKKREIEELDEDNQCEPIVVPILSYSSSLNELTKKLGISPESLALVTDDIKVLYSQNVRDSYEKSPQDTLEAYQRFVRHLNNLESTLPLFLQAGEVLYDIGDEIARSLPRTSQGLEIMDENDWFGGEYEKPIIGTVGGVGGFFAVLSLVLFQYLGVTRSMLDKLRGIPITWWWRCCEATARKIKGEEEEYKMSRTRSYEDEAEEDPGPDTRFIGLNQPGQREVPPGTLVRSISKLVLNRDLKTPETRRSRGYNPHAPSYEITVNPL